MFKKTLIFFYIFTIFSSYLYAVDYEYNIQATSAIVVHAQTNKVLFQKNEKDRVYPASITKLMSLYIVFDFLKDQLVSLDSIVTVSKNAYTQGNYRNGVSSMFLRQGQKVTVEELITGISVTSANDAVIALAEFISGTEENFIASMNRKASELGLENTSFSNVDGLHDINNYSTVKDLTVLSNSIRDKFPEYYYFFSIDEITYNGITQYNRNSLISYPFNNNIRVDGLKTGHIDESGYSVAFSATQNSNFRVIGTVIGTQSEQDRTNEVSRLINWLYRNYEERVIYHKGDLIKELPVYNGSTKTIQLIADKDIIVIFPKNIDHSSIKQTLSFKNYYNAPIKQGDKIATLDIQTGNTYYDISYDILAQENIELSSSILSYILSPYYAIKKLFGL